MYVEKMSKLRTDLTLCSIIDNSLFTSCVAVHCSVHLFLASNLFVNATELVFT